MRLVILNKDVEWIVYEVVTAKTIDEAEKVAQSNDINPTIEPLEDFLENNIDMDSIREQLGQEQEDQRNDQD